MADSLLQHSRRVDLDSTELAANTRRHDWELTLSVIGTMLVGIGLALIGMFG